MAETEPTPDVPKLTPEQRQQVVKLFARAKQVLASGNLDYAIELLMDCCKRDPANIPLRQELRKSEKNKYNDNKKGKPLSFLSTWRTTIRMVTANQRKKYIAAVELAEEVFQHNPWHIRASLSQSHAFNQLGLKDLALWTLDQVRPVAPENPTINRAMATLFEERGQFTQAIGLWRLVAKKCPKDLKAAKKATNLAASETIMKGGYDEAAGGTGPSPIKKEKLTQRVAVEGETAGESLAAERIAKDENMYLKRIADAPSNPSAYLQLGQLYRRNDMLDKARDIFKKGLAAVGQHFEMSLEILDLDIDHFRKDLVLTEEKRAADPKNADLKTKADALTKEISNRELAMYRSKSDRFPTDTVARFEMAVRLYKTEKYDEAINELQKLRADPKHRVRVLLYLGFCFTARNNWKLAQKNFEDGLQNLGAAEEDFRKDVMYNLAVGYSKNGELPRAIELGVELANMDYGFKNIGTLIEQWQAKNKDDLKPQPPKDPRKR